MSFTTVKEMSRQAETPIEPRYGLEAWFIAMGQTDFARMDENKPLVHEVMNAAQSAYWITAEGLLAIHEGEQQAYVTFCHYRDIARLPMSI